MNFGQENRVSQDGSICTLSATHYLSYGSLGAFHDSMVTARFALDTGAGFNVIRQSSLPPNCESQVDENATPPKLCDANGRPL